MKRHTLLYYLTLTLLASSCTETISTDSAEQDAALPIELSSTYPVITMQTRASMENGFVADDAVGIFVADYDNEGNAATPALKGERAGNVKFTYDGTRWTANYQLYWKNAHTPADFYGYCPYDQQMQSVTEYAFTISRRQDSETGNTSAAGYEASDLLWAKATKVQPTTETISLQYKHLMAGITVTLQMGTGFEAEEWAALDKAVQIENTILNGSVDLSTGTATVGNGSTTTIIPLPYNGSWRAVVYPQAVDAGKSIASITIDGQTYQLKKDVATTYQSGKMHNMTITVDRSEATGQYTCTLLADDIVVWVDDPNLHDGLVRQYTIITLQAAGSLQATMDEAGIDYDKLENLKIVGPMNVYDRIFIGEHLKALKNLNLQQVEMDDGILSHLGGLSRLQHVTFPAKGIWKIDYHAFEGDALIGSLTIPEGVTELRQCAFWGNRLTGPLTLPSTLKIMEEAFSGNLLTGELNLPEGLEQVTAPSGDFSGTFYFPPSLKKLDGWWHYSKMTGTITIPTCMTEIPGLCFSGSGCTQVEFHDGVTTINGGAFIGSQLSGELVLPPNLKVLGDKAFAETRITKIIFPKSLRVMNTFQDEGVFANCTYLTGTVELPENVTRIPCGCFRGCTAITGLVIPRGVDIIQDIAFKDCYSLNSIICEDEDPPVLYKNVFQGVPKDNFTVEVPKGCVEKYREAPGWSEFKRIAEYSNFVCRPMQANALNNAHTEELVLNADGPWQVERLPDWVTVSPSSGTGKTQLTLTFKQLAHDSDNRSDSIVFVMPDEGHHTFCVVSQYDYEQEEDSYLTLQKATKGNRGGIDIVFVGDGYDGEDISNGNYLNLVKEQTEHFFDLEPYKSHRDYFNVYVTFPLSQEKGVNTMNTYVNNHFGTLYGYIGDGSSNQLLTEDDEVRQYVQSHITLSNNDISRTLIILVPNSDAYEGVTYYAWYGSPISICPPSSRPYPQDTRGVIQHEAGGHGFAYLGDEEITYSAWAPTNVKSLIDDRKRSGWYANLSTISGLHSVSWADFVFDTRYSDQVDVFEGGFGYMRGIFRPEQNSCMNYGIPYYNAPSRLSIMRRIFDYAGEWFSMDYFYEHDSKEWGSTGNARQTRGTVEAFSGSSYASSNQHHVPMVIDNKKMANRVRIIRQELKNKKDKTR